MDIKGIVKQRFAAYQNIPVERVDLNADLAAVYGVNSMAGLKLVNAAEVEFDISIELDEARSIKTLNDAIALITRKFG